MPSLSSKAEPTPGMVSVDESPEFSPRADNRITGPKTFLERRVTPYRSPPSFHELQKLTVYGGFLGESKLRLVSRKWWIRAAELVLVLPIASLCLLHSKPLVCLLACKKEPPASERTTGSQRVYIVSCIFKTTSFRKSKGPYIQKRHLESKSPSRPINLS